MNIVRSLARHLSSVLVSVICLGQFRPHRQRRSGKTSQKSKGECNVREMKLRRLADQITTPILPNPIQSNMGDLDCLFCLAAFGGNAQGREALISASLAGSLLISYDSNIGRSVGPGPLLPNAGLLPWDGGLHVEGGRSHSHPCHADIM